MARSTTSSAMPSAFSTLPSSTTAPSSTTSPSPYTYATTTPLYYTRHVFASSCSEAFNMYNVTSNSTTLSPFPTWIPRQYNNNNLGFGTLVETYGFIDRSAPYYEDCFQPPGRGRKFMYDNAAYTYSWIKEDDVYHNAVCPLNWVALGVARTSYAGYGTYRYYSTAHCCRAGHSLAPDIWGLGYEPGISTYTAPMACVQNLAGYVLGGTKWLTVEWVGTTSPEGCPWPCTVATSVLKWQDGRVFYPAWTVEWIDEDNKVMTPPWPSLTRDMVLDTWTPGDRVFYDKGPKTISWDTAIGIISMLAVLCFLFVLGGVVLLWKRRRRRRRLEREEKARVADERSRTLMIDDRDVGVPIGNDVRGDVEQGNTPVNPTRTTAAGANWWERRRERKKREREPKPIELVEREIPLG